MKFTDQELVILRAAQKLNHRFRAGGIASITQVVKALAYPKATTKKVILGLAKKGVIALHTHDYPQSLSRDERKLLIYADKRYYNAFALRNDLPAEIFGMSNPTQKQLLDEYLRKDAQLDAKSRAAGKSQGLKAVVAIEKQRDALYEQYRARYERRKVEGPGFAQRVRTAKKMNPKRKTKRNGSDIRQITLGHIRAGRKWPQIRKLMDGAGFSAAQIKEAEGYFKAEYKRAAPKTIAKGRDVGFASKAALLALLRKQPEYEVSSGSKAVRLAEQHPREFSVERYGSGKAIISRRNPAKRKVARKRTAPPVRARGPRTVAKKRIRKNPSYTLEATPDPRAKTITHEFKVPTKTLANLAMRGYVQEALGGITPNAFNYKITKLGFAHYRVEAKPKIKAARATVKALTGGSATRKFKRTLSGPSKSYEISLQRNPKRAKAKKTVKRRRNAYSYDETRRRLGIQEQKLFAQLQAGGLTAAQEKRIKTQLKNIERRETALYVGEIDREGRSDPGYLADLQADIEAAAAADKKRYAKKKKNAPRRRPIVKTRRRRNDGRSDREEFAGSVKGQKALYFPPGTPPSDELSTLGPLESFTTTGRGKINFQKGQAILCQDTDHNLYVGLSKPVAALYSNGGPLRNADLGKIKQVEYDCAKPHLGEEYAKKTQWFHDFESPLPHLRTDEEGRPIIEGGGYTIKREGVVG